MSLVLSGDTGVSGNSGALIAGTAVASTSGTSIDFTSIPSWVKRITVMLNGVSTNGASNLQVQLGAGSVDTSGYSSAASYCGAATAGQAATSGFLFSIGVGAGNAYGGSMIITLVGGNAWVYQSTFTYGGGSAYTVSGGGNKTLSGTLDRVRITTANGTDTFDAGSINILYE